MVFSPNQLRMDDQYCILLISRLEDVEFDIISVKRNEYFEFTDIIEDKYPYPALLGIEWPFENYVVIEFKRKTMMFEVDGMRIIQPLDLYQGLSFTEPVDDVEYPNLIDNYINLPLGGKNIILTPQ